MVAIQSSNESRTDRFLATQCSKIYCNIISWLLLPLYSFILVSWLSKATVLRQAMASCLLLHGVTFTICLWYLGLMTLWTWISCLVVNAKKLFGGILYISQFLKKSSLTPVTEQKFLKHYFFKKKLHQNLNL